MSTASKFAESIAKRMLVAKAQDAFDQEYSSALERVAAEADEALAPVRECLEGLSLRVVAKMPCWCGTRDKNDHWRTPLQDHEHEESCQATRQLWERLKIQ